MLRSIVMCRNFDCPVSKVVWPKKGNKGKEERYFSRYPTHKKSRGYARQSQVVLWWGRYKCWAGGSRSPDRWSAADGAQSSVKEFCGCAVTVKSASVHHGCTPYSDYRDKKLCYCRGTVRVHCQLKLCKMLHKCSTDCIWKVLQLVNYLQGHSPVAGLVTAVPAIW